MSSKRRVGGSLLAGALVFAASCGDIKTVPKDGYRALLVFATGERYPLAVRGEKRRVAGNFDGSELVKVFRPDLGKVWQYRPSTRRLLEEAWSPIDEIVPGYPLDPRFDSAAYAQRFGGLPGFISPTVMPIAAAPARRAAAVHPTGLP